MLPTIPRPFEGVQASPQPGPYELETLSVVGNKHSSTYRLPHCSGYSQINMEKRVEFASEAEAEAAGYRRAESSR